MDYGAMLKAVKIAHQKSGKNRIGLFYDMVRCGFAYGCGYTDYNCFAFYQLTPQQKATYITRKGQNEIVAHFNNKEYYPYFINKELFNETFHAFMQRSYLNLQKASPDDFATFLAGRANFIAKPIDGMCGQGVEKIKVTKTTDAASLYDQLKSKNLCLVEETIQQHAAISAIYPHSVNTVRIMTIVDGDHADIIFACLRMGSGQSVVDNMVAGGMCALIDIPTGIISKPAANLKTEVFYEHPDTKHVFVGTLIPHFDLVKKTVQKAAMLVPQIRYVGWDVAITPDGVELIEGNEFPCHQLMQSPFHLENGIGMLPTVKKYW